MKNQQPDLYTTDKDFEVEVLDLSWDGGFKISNNLLILVILYKQSDSIVSKRVSDCKK
jgi:hypothetical protein